MQLNRTLLVTLGAMAGASAAIFLSVRRRLQRLEAIKQKVAVQDWESQPVPSAKSGVKTAEQRSLNANS